MQIFQGKRCHLKSRVTSKAVPEMTPFCHQNSAGKEICSRQKDVTSKDVTSGALN
jgi:hypothetical protein